MTARGAPRASAHDKVVAVSRPWADEGASSVLGTITAGADRALGWLWGDPCRLDVLGGLVSLEDDFFEFGSL
jgi:hypothetical protein